MDYHKKCETKIKFLVYDNACNLAKMVVNKNTQKEILFNNTTKLGKAIKDMTIVCDRFHFQKHNDKWCDEHCDPDKHKEMKGINTSTSEQINYWYTRFKHSMKHMNYSRYHFMLFILSDEYNKFELVDYKYEATKINKK